MLLQNTWYWTLKNPTKPLKTKRNFKLRFNCNWFIRLYNSMSMLHISQSTFKSGCNFENITQFFIFICSKLRNVLTSWTHCFPEKSKWMLVTDFGSGLTPAPPRAPSLAHTPLMEWHQEVFRMVVRRRVTLGKSTKLWNNDCCAINMT